MRLRRIAVLMFMVGASFLTGCGGAPSAPKGVVLTGRLLNDGKPMELTRPDVGLGMVEVILFSDNSAVPREFGKTDKEGRFEIRGPGNGVQPGSYKLAVRHWKEGKGTKDELDGRFTAEKTPIVIEIPAKNVGGKYDLGEIELTSYDKAKA